MEKFILHPISEDAWEIRVLKSKETVGKAFKSDIGFTVQSQYLMRTVAETSSLFFSLKLVFASEEFYIFTDGHLIRIEDPEKLEAAMKVSS